MSLANGRAYLAIPGPSVIPDAVLRSMHRASPNIYEGELHDLTDSLIPDLKAVAMTKQNVAIYIGNGHAAWEAALSNVLSEGDTVLVLATGRFCIGWGEMAEGLGVTVQTIDFGDRADVDLAKVEDALRADKAGKIKAVLAVHVDTSTSVKNDVAGLRRVLDTTGHDALLMADCIASLGCDRFEMDAWGVDVMVAACQKGLMTPAGICFVYYNAKANARRPSRVSRYWDWRARTEPEHYFQYFDGTAPTHHLYGLRTALDMIKDEGLDHVFARHEALAKTVWAAFDCWSTEGPLALNIADPAKRSHAVTSATAGSPNADALRHWCEHKAGLTLGIGLGRTPADAFFRIGHMGHVNAQMIMGVLGTMEAGLIALKIPHGKGAVEAAASVIAATA
ncbi:MAG: aminotransferase class V-fold PLP-dependent enzyme [Loktanella sp.]|jgi:alanine-glyoxylate transaminase / serine-glyoxylate transaminase / serine-pyruvate transaminase|nr:aminotransferase class V-fold PLP-dependent enzyme [Loktanella sp.]MDO7607842.1 aminotransferase class V-fold PLP-dependent enzyme [Loktanella sp.]MDO7624180.1 aminotransferase class V-fold PLP-dependent enzyme [Loktanella sp.]MDO7625856.1 aminotransferase class V-fold PLP-dependent enzyme [Loktanella sp.]MDO7631921.1 aminotransferase class V-fold PLP-dependent enzyme [Loktanella sp.]